LLRILEEARACEPDEIIVVSSRDKADMNAAVEEWSRTLFADMPLSIVYQDVQKGAAHAVAQAEVEDDAVIFFGDCLIVPSSPAARMANLVFRGMDGCIAVETVPDHEVSRYGIAEVDENFGAITRLIEKPQPHETASRWAVAGRIALNHSLIAFLSEETVGIPMGQEVAIPTLLAKAILNGADIRAVPLSPDQKRVDCGTPEEYLEAQLERWD
ncbi:MAG: sugar phosphate nucleotidyltransferase, partial [Fimbriimonas sp.]